MIADNIKIKTTPKVYSPREDSYLLAQAVEEHASGRVLDMGTGSGLQGIIAAKKGCDVVFADISNAALACARENAEANMVSGGFIKTDMFNDIHGKFNTIIFNPPYLHSAPVSGTGNADYSLDGGINGREVIDRFIKGVYGHLEEEHVVLLLESSLNGYHTDIERLNAQVVASQKMFFEELAVLLFRVGRKA